MIPTDLNNGEASRVRNAESLGSDIGDVTMNGQDVQKPIRAMFSSESEPLTDRTVEKDRRRLQMLEIADRVIQPRADDNGHTFERRQRSRQGSSFIMWIRSIR